MKKIIYILTLILIIFGYSCTKLDEELYNKLPDDVYPENEEQLAAIGVSAYEKMRLLGDDEGWWFLAQEVTSDEAFIPVRGTDWLDGGKWINMHMHVWTNEDEGVNRMWDVFWQGISECNFNLDLLKSLEQTDAIIVKIAELETLRAFYYYLLIDNYGDAPYLSSLANSPEFPYKAYRAAIFDSITASLESNYPNLVAEDNKYKATRYMAFSLLAKLYLNAEVYTGTPQWVKAEQYIDSVLAGPYTLDSDIQGPFKIANENCSEIIFSIPYDEDNVAGFRIHMRTLHYEHNKTYDMTVGPWNGFCAVYDHFATYSNDDLRKDIWFIYGPQYTSSGDPLIDPVTGTQINLNPVVPQLQMSEAANTPDEIRNTGARLGKYEIGPKENLSNDFPLFRLTDFYLMKAEVLIENGGNGDSWINPIRSRAGLADWTGTTLDSLLLERGRELYCEGHRRQDLIRYDKFTKEWWEKDPSDASRLTFPIPQWAIDANPNLALDPQ